MFRTTGRINTNTMVSFGGENDELFSLETRRMVKYEWILEKKTFQNRNNL